MICICGYDNIEGSDICEECGSDLNDMRDVMEKKKGLRKNLLKDPILKLKVPKPIIIQSDTTVAEAIRQMQEREYGSVVVVDDGQLTGIFTESDVLMKIIGKYDDLEKLTVSQFMKKGPGSVNINETTAIAFHFMSEKGYTHIPVEDEGNIIGITSNRGLLAYVNGTIG